MTGTVRLLACAWLLSACIAPSPPSPPEAPARSRPANALKPASPARCAWPQGAEAAVSLTYDDALGSQLDFALPVLERYGLKATFFLSGSNLARFAALTQHGHELGSHTIRHPCNAELAALDLREMASELDASIAELRALGVTEELTFAYPCGQTQVKRMTSYVPLVKQRFRAARGVAGAVAEPDQVDLFNVPALFPPQGSDGSDVLSFLERARASHGWAVVGVHGVSAAGEYLQLSQPAHDAVVAYLAEHTRELWTAPFGAVADVVAHCQAAAPLRDAPQSSSPSTLRPHTGP